MFSQIRMFFFVFFLLFCLNNTTYSSNRFVSAAQWTTDKGPPLPYNKPRNCWKGASRFCERPAPKHPRRQRQRGCAGCHWTSYAGTRYCGPPTAAGGTTAQQCSGEQPTSHQRKHIGPGARDGPYNQLAHRDHPRSPRPRACSTHHHRH